MERLIAGIVVLTSLLLPWSVQAGVPLDTVQAHVNSVMEVLRDQKLKPEAAKEIKKEKLRAIYGRMFDEVELSRRTLARNWNSLNDAQRREFIQLFRRVLEKAYIDKILAYRNEKIVFERESILTESQAEIQTRIVTSSKEIPIHYRVILRGGAWGVYDVLVENVSLVQNYRTQFNDILSKNSPEKLLEILRKKVKEQG